MGQTSFNLPLELGLSDKSRQVWEETKEKVAVALLTKQSEGAANWKWTFYLLYGFETGVEKLGVVQLQENTCDP